MKAKQSIKISSGQSIEKNPKSDGKFNSSDSEKMVSDPLNEISDENLEVIKNEQLTQIFDENMQEIADDQLAEFMNDELNSLIEKELSQDENEYLSQIVMDAKDKKLDQDIIKEFRMAKTRKTTRSTFSLSERSFQILKRLEDNYDYSPRMIFREAAKLPTPDKETVGKNSNAEKNIVKRKRKTFVLDVQSLEVFNDNAKRLNLSRDQIVDAHIAALYHLLAQANQTEVELAREYGNQIMGYDADLSELASKAEEDFGSEDHLIVRGVGIAATYLMTVHIAIDNFIQTGIWEDQNGTI